jgi:hypothetical protein
MDRDIFEGMGCSSIEMYIRSIAGITSYTQAPIKFKEVRIWQG